MVVISLVCDICLVLCFIFMIRRPPRCTRTYTLWPDTPLFRSMYMPRRLGLVAPARVHRRYASLCLLQSRLQSRRYEPAFARIYNQGGDTRSWLFESSIFAHL